MSRLLVLLLSIVSSAVLVSGCATRSALEEYESGLERRLVFTVSKQDSTNFAFSGGSGESSVEAESEALVSRILKLHGLRKIAQWPIKALGLEAIVAEFRGKRQINDVLQALSQDGRVESVEPVITFDLLSYNDPYFDLQSASVKGDDIERVHELATGKDVVVAMIDTGVDRTHPELSGSIVYARNFVEHDQARFDSDEHGTTVAGIISAAVNNDVGIVGVAPGAKLMVFKACRHDLTTTRATCDSLSSQAPDVLNLSLAGPRAPIIERLIKLAHSNGMVITGAVDARRQASFPASMAEVIPVGAPMVSSTLPTHGVIAPGTDVLTTTPGSSYGFRSGSSMATAYVSGVVALIKERQPLLSIEGIRLQLANGSDQLIPVVDVCNAVSDLDKGELCPSAALVGLDEKDVDQQN
jgi:subtilisin family serine protease